MSSSNNVGTPNKAVLVIVAVAAPVLFFGVLYMSGLLGMAKNFVVSRFFSPVEDFYQSQFEYEKIIDVRDKQKYHAIKIGDQFWIAQNMNYATESSVCDSCELYGRLYTHEEALNVCPEGFVLPSYWDYKKLKRSLQGTEKWFTDKGTQGTKLWFSVKGVSGGIDTLGFAAIPSGFFSYKDSVVRRRGDMAGYWTADYDRDYALRLKIDIKNDLSTIEGLARDYGFAVRCIKRESSVQNKEKTLLIDGRNSKYYRTTTIGGVRWMAQNLDYKVKKSWCLNDDDSMCGMLGRLYAWDAAQTACPSGWHLPRKSELDSLVFAVGGKSVAGLALKMQDSWNGDSATDSYLFSAFPVGFRDGKKGTYENGMTSTHFWSSSEATKSSAYALELEAGKNSAQVRTIRKDYGVSVRCVEGDPDFGVVVDSRDGKKYKFVKIGSQVWMAENLNYETENSFCYDDESANCEKYGRLFTWEAAMEACPNGWHLPSAAEFEKLLNYVGRNAAEKLKAKNDWDKSGSDEFGFAALPGGAVGSGDGEPGNWFIGGATFFTSTIDEDNGYGPQPFVLHIDEYNSDEVSIESMNGNIWGHSVRCLQDEVANLGESSTSSSSSVQSSSYMQPISYGTLVDTRDGQTYNTVVIGSQTWMAENLNYETAGSICYEDDSSCIKYGRLYTWTDAMNNEKGCNYLEREKCGDVQGVCPDGWHLPKDSEWSELHDYVMMKWGNNESWGVPKALLVKSSEAPDGTNVSGFSANLHDPGFCVNCFPFIRFWTTIELYRDQVCTWELQDSRFSEERKGKYDYAVVRCLKNSP